ncbi:MAG: sigma-70 family RNA polymerase sigma factor [Kiritimatiellae bacterium]|nr:sigma-70 family RNA polymerase sigma factor [Kiritimatiellia bacterium]
MDIISEIRNAPEDGAKRLEREYKARLLSVAMNLCHDEHEAESLVYDTMGKAVAEIKSLSKPDALFSWMCSILVNTHNKATRRKSNEKVVYTDSLPDSPEEVGGADSVFNSVDGALLHDAIAELPEKLREAVILRYFMGMPLVQVARFLKIPVGTVNSRLHLARKALVARLNPTAKKLGVVAAAGLLLLGVFAGAVAILSDEKSTKTTVETTAIVLDVPVVPAPPETPTSSPPKEAQPMKTLAKSAAMVATALVLPASYGGVEATGGTTKIAGRYMVHTFTNSGTFTVTQGGKVDVLIVAGGGGGGAARCGGGGGGAGGVVYQEDLTITSGVFTVTVGAGGSGAIGINSDSATSATKGEDSYIEGFDVAIAKGGGAGGSANWTSGQTSGGSGGGRGGVYDNDGNGSAGTSGQGFAGGGSKNGTTYAYMRAGGGGGAGGAGTKGIGGTNSSTSTSGTGGIGVMYDISGEEKWYGGGGGGGGSSDGLTVAGGKGGGGSGKGRSGSTNVAGTAGTTNTGGGGGGGGGYSGTKSADGGAGGSGIVIVRYAIDTKDTFEEITGGKRTLDGDYEIHTFTNSGTFKVSGCSLVDVLVVGGGGGGGAAYSGGGGGGAGGVIYKQDIALLSGEYEIVVGKGGTGGVVNEAGTAITTYSANGSASSALGFTAKGGGRGGNTNEEGGGGASGGGGAAYTSITVFKRMGGGARDAGQGNYGGTSTNNYNSGLIGVAGGGGGAGENGHDGVITSLANAGRGNYGGAGGDGIACSITGEEKWYGGGGGGGFSTYVNANERGKVPGGKGGGGRGSGRYTTNPPVIHSGTDGENGTGGGGGGGGGYSPNMANGGKGGDGIVIIRCKRIPKGFILIVQ